MRRNRGGAQALRPRHGFSVSRSNWCLLENQPLANACHHRSRAESGKITTVASLFRHKFRTLALDWLGSSSSSLSLPKRCRLGANGSFYVDGWVNCLANFRLCP